MNKPTSNKIYRHTTVAALITQAIFLLGKEHFWYNLFIWICTYLIILVLTSELSK